MQAFQQLFPGLDIQWDVVRCYEDGSLPPITDLARYDALALSGSHHSAADDTPWIRRLAAWLANVVQDGPPRLRIVGLCFGSQASLAARQQIQHGSVSRNVSLIAAIEVDSKKSSIASMFSADSTDHPQLRCLMQILARALGGTVGKNPSGRFVLKGALPAHLPMGATPG